MNIFPTTLHVTCIYFLFYIKTQKLEIRSERNVKMAKIDYPIKRAENFRLRTVNMGHFNMHFWPNFKLLWSNCTFFFYKMWRFRIVCTYVIFFMWHSEHICNCNVIFLRIRMYFLRETLRTYLRQYSAYLSQTILCVPISDNTLRTYLRQFVQSTENVISQSAFLCPLSTCNKLAILHRLSELKYSLENEMTYILIWLFAWERCNSS